MMALNVVLVLLPFSILNVALVLHSGGESEVELVIGGSVINGASPSSYFLQYLIR